MEIIPKPPTKMPKLQKYLLYFSIGLLILTVFGYFIIESSFEKANQTLKDLEETLAKAETPEEQNLEKEMLNEQRKIKDFSTLIDRHIVPSNFLNLLEKTSHPKVWFSGIELKPREGKVSLSGTAEDLIVLGQQLLIFKNEKAIQDIKLSQISLIEKGKIRFDLEFSLSPEIFKF